jgi:hypothetical protein
LHEETYLALGFKLVYIDSATALQRVEAIKRGVGPPQESYLIENLRHTFFGP